MTVRTLVVTGFAGIAVLVAGALVAIALLDGRAGPSRARAPTALEPAPQSVLPSAQEVAARAEVSSPPAETAPLRDVAPAGAAPPLGEGAVPWGAVPLALRPAGLGRALAAPVANGLAGARASMAPCFDEERRRLAGPDPEPPPAEAYGPAVLVVRLEAGPGKLVVAGTEIGSRGTSSRELIECCRRSLVGWELDAPAAAPPARYRVQLLLR